ncbi:MAG: DUF4382 domain-containing protein [Rubrivivax sp.]
MNFRSFLAALGAALILAGCGGAGEPAATPGSGTAGSTASATTGTLQVSLTDAPACGYEQVNVTVVGVRVHKSESAGDDDSGWVDLPPLPPLATPYQSTGVRINLLDLTNGALQGLGQVVLPAGKYTQMRLILAANSGNAAPFANSVLPVGDVETALTTPSAQKSGLKIKLDVDVPPGQVAHVVVDFDACKSVVKRGKSGQYNLKPVLTATVLLSELEGMRVTGWVSMPLAKDYANVSLQFNGVPVKATVPDPQTGKFVLYPVPVGQYDLVVATRGYVTALMTGVPVLATTNTVVSTPLQRIDAAPSDTRAVIGKVTPATAELRALQTFNGGPTVEVAWGAVDGDTGAFGFALPIDAPVRTSYLSVSPLLDQTLLPQPDFVPDLPAKGLYTIEARSGASQDTKDIDVAAPVEPLTFIVP